MNKDFKVSFPNVNFPAVNLPYIEGKLAPPQSEEIWYNYLIVYEGEGDYKGRILDSYDHIITFKDIEKIEEDSAREYYKKCGTDSVVLVVDVILLSVGKKDQGDED